MAGDISTLFDKWYARSGQIAPVRIPKLTRRRLAELFCEHGLTRGVEVGVDRGRFSEWMLTRCPEMELLLVDPWRWKLRGESRYQSAARRMEPFGDRATIVRADSMDAVWAVPEGSLDFCYIDGNHEFDYVISDLVWWARRVRYGGVVAGHDYYRFRGGGVVPAVDAYTREHGITRWFLTDEKEATFFWLRARDPFEFEGV